MQSNTQATPPEPPAAAGLCSRSLSILLSLSLCPLPVPVLSSALVTASSKKDVHIPYRDSKLVRRLARHAVDSALFAVTTDGRA